MTTRPASSQLLIWIAITFLLFPVLILLGILMRSIQAGEISALQPWFYPAMTLHGVGMVGVWYVAAMACAADVLSRHVTLPPALGRLAIAGTVLGVVLLLACVLLGRFAAAFVTCRR